MDSKDIGLHDIDKAVAVLEATTKEHHRRAEKELSEIKAELVLLKRELIGVKVKVFGVAAGISVIVGSLPWLLRSYLGS